MKKHFILIFFVTLNLQTIGQSLSDTIVNVFFNKFNDTIVVVKSSKYSKEKNNLFYYKTYKEIDTTKSPKIEPSYKPYSTKSIKSIIDSLNKIGYMLGENISEEIKVYSVILIKKETIDKTFGNVYNYNICRNIVLHNDTIFKDNYYNEVQRIGNNFDPNVEIGRNIKYETIIWQSKDKRLLYCIFNSGRFEYGIDDGAEYYISTTQSEILKK
jgi:hypothetical protein